MPTDGVVPRSRLTQYILFFGIFCSGVILTVSVQRGLDAGLFERVLVGIRVRDDDRSATATPRVDDDEQDAVIVDERPSSDRVASTAAANAEVHAAIVAAEEEEEEDGEEEDAAGETTIGRARVQIEELEEEIRYHVAELEREIAEECNGGLRNGTTRADGAGGTPATLVERVSVLEKRLAYNCTVRDDVAIAGASPKEVDAMPSVQEDLVGNNFDPVLTKPLFTELVELMVRKSLHCLSFAHAAAGPSTGAQVCGGGR